MLRETWNSLKLWRRWRLGPVSLIFRLGRTVTVSKNRAPRRPARVQDQTPAQPASQQHLAQTDVAVVFGAGPGLGFALAEKLVAQGARVALVSRQSKNLQPLCQRLNQRGAAGRALVYSCDATDERGVREVLGLISRDLGVPTLVVFSMQNTVPGRAVDISTPAFEDCWRTICLAGFIVAREAARLMLARRQGSIILIGSTSGMVGREEHLTHAVGKFGLRALSQVMARELWPEGLHVAHVVIDATIDEPGAEPDISKSNPTDLAEAIYAVHEQKKGAWSSEVDLRTWNIRFWEHC